MRDRRRPRLNSKQDNTLDAVSASGHCPVQVERIFRPDEVDLDDLAEAIRPLLAHGGTPSRRVDLLSGPTRVTYVVEANRIP